MDCDLKEAWNTSEGLSNGTDSGFGFLPKVDKNNKSYSNDQKSSSSLQRMMMLQEEEENDNDHRIMESEMNHFNGKSKSSIPSSMLLYREGSDEESIPVKNKEKKLKDMNKRKRVIQKNGLTNVSYKNISKKRRRYFNDLYTTLLDSSWNYCVLLFTASFFGSWMFFAILYYIIAYIHGDLDMGHLPSDGGDWMPCILEIDGFSAAFLFSLETQHTIGYGGRQTTTKCSDAIIIVSLQAVLGCIIQAFMVGLVFSKLSRPRNRSKTVIFSNNAVIMQRDRKLCLVIRIGDLRDDNFILGTQISMKILRRKTTEEGEIYHEMKNLKVELSSTCIFFVWPLDIVHIIDEDSPFYNMAAADLARDKFELLVVLEGTNETSNMAFQARTSYLPNEILWGHRFEVTLLYNNSHNKFQVNFSAFHSTYEVDTPACSARTLAQWQHTSGRQKIINVKSKLAI